MACSYKSSKRSSIVGFTTRTFRTCLAFPTSSCIFLRTR
jgi:hypothetical protein